MADPVAFQKDAFQLDSFQTDTLQIIVPAGTLTLAAATPLNIDRHIFNLPAPSYGPAFQQNAFQDNAFQGQSTSTSLVLFAPTLTVGHRFTVPAGLLSLNTATPLFRSARLISVGALALTGYAPTFSRRIAINVPGAGAGAFQLGAFEIETFQVRGDGGLHLSSQVVVARRIAITPPAANLALTAQTPLLGRVRFVPVGALTLTGFAPTLVGDRVILVPLPGAESIQTQLPGYAFAEKTSGQIQVPGGPFVDFSYQVGLVAEAKAPTILRSFNLAAGSLVLAGIAPTLIQGHVIQVPYGALALTGLTPLLRHRWPIPAGALFLTGETPDVVIAANALPAGQLVITGYAPTLASSRIVIVPYSTLQMVAGTLVVTVHFGPPVTFDYFLNWIKRDG